MSAFHNINDLVVDVAADVFMVLQMALGTMSAGQRRPVPARPNGFSGFKGFDNGQRQGRACRRDLRQGRGQLLRTERKGTRWRTGLGVLIDRQATPEASAQALSGQEVSADVNWSSEAVRFESARDTGSSFATVPALAAQSSRNYNLGGTVALCIGVFLSLAGLVLRMR